MTKCDNAGLCPMLAGVVSECGRIVLTDIGESNSATATVFDRVCIWVDACNVAIDIADGQFATICHAKALAYGAFATLAAAFVAL